MQRSYSIRRNLSAQFQKNELVFRLESFPVSLLQQLRTTYPVDVERFRSDVGRIARLIVDCEEGPCV